MEKNRSPLGLATRIATIARSDGYVGALSGVQFPALKPRAAHAARGLGERNWHYAFVRLLPSSSSARLRLS